MTELWVATTNQGKLSEFKSLLSGVDLHGASEMKVYSAPPETGATFVDNARIKARSMKAMKPGVWVVADDSGLEVDGLGKMPGVHSARYAGPKASDAENNAKVLKMLQIRSPLNRKARFVCAFVVFDPTGQEHVIDGVVEGSIAEKAVGQAGFGYDAIFIPEGESKTFGELGLAFKNKISHRGQAIRKLYELLQSK
ncbi:MAG: RdgB/HAM1 family non-canonical purine NTP pyrophosphatase [Bdellovibrionales bacterium]